MDEVLNYSDLNDLESRLYAKIHHEFDDDSKNTERRVEQQPTEDVQPSTQRLVTATSVINIQAGSNKSPRYWVGNQNSTKQPKINQTNSLSDVSPNAVKIPIVNPFAQQRTFRSPKPKNYNPKSGKSKHFNVQPNPNQSNQNLKKNKTSSLQSPKMKPNKSQRRGQRDNQPLPPNIKKNGPFARQVDKLQKVIKYANKKQMSQKSRTKKPTTSNDIIDLNSSSDCDEVVIIPQPPAPLIILDDSDVPSQENSEDESTHEELTDDVGQIQGDNDKDNENLNVLEGPSRCTSPCVSVMSSDDFIGQTDRSRLLSGSGVADDEDLQLLTADVDSLMEAPKSSKCLNSNQTTMETDNAVDDDVVGFAQFINEAQYLSNSRYYRVEHGTQFRALDVYESESDITDSVYAKGATKTTVIRAIGSSSESDVEDIILTRKTKHFRKSRTSGSNRGSETNANDSNSDNNDGVRSTAVPFISRGPAVEHCKKKTRRNSIPCARRSSQGGRMSDNDFIATLNTLAQGGSDNEDADEADEDSDDVEMPTARAIAESVLGKEKPTQTVPQIAYSTIAEDGQSENEILNLTEVDESANAAVPETVLASLDCVFDKIDQLAQPKTIAAPGNPTDVAESHSDEDEDEVEIIEETPREIVRSKSDRKNPTYHVVYSRDNSFNGINWNDEMRRFYNNLWDGEHFTLKQVWQNMDDSRNLWKIYTEDRFPKTRRFSNLKCNNCYEYGHIRAKCTRPRKPLICYMCGESGHHEPRCPNTICLRCGNKTHVFTKSCNACTFQNRLICPLCKVRGHTLNFCPDKWRRYHSTTEPNMYPNSHTEYKNKKCCCICGGRGHWPETCKSAVRFMEYPNIVSEIKSHEKSYNDQSRKAIQSGIALNLLYESSKDYSFDMAENTTPNKYYGRFLKAVGMGYLLNRKRKTANDTEQSPKKKSKTHQHYTRNPYLLANRKESEDTTATSVPPDQVPEVSESGNQDEVREDTAPSSVVAEIDAEVIENDNHEDAVLEDPAPCGQNEVVAKNCQTDCETLTEIVDMDDIGITDDPALITFEENAETNSFKTPTEVANYKQASNAPTDCTLHGDSDSNYSFSEHFDESALISNAVLLEATVPPSAPSAPSTAIPPLEGKSKSRRMSPLPDYIPLTSENDAAECMDVNLTTGCLSSRYVTANSDEEDAVAPLPDVPCEAKIYLTHFHSEYFQSHAGQKFLKEASKMYNIKARLDWTSVGHVMILFGLPSNQNRFHTEMLLQYRLLSDQMNQKQSLITQKVPKRVDTLTRLLRENINQLLSNLGNVNELLKRLKHQEGQNSNSGRKMADKSRRTLNMILLGQAGLLNGSLHLDKLLLFLKTLINNYNPEEITTDDFRNDIDKHWKMIFTPYRHDNYPELVRTYNKLLSKNRIPKLNIDPILLGLKVLDTTLTRGQKKQLEAGGRQNKAKIVPNPLCPKNASLLNKIQNEPINPPSSSTSTPINLKSHLNSGNNTSSRPSMNLATLQTSTEKAPPPPLMKLMTFQTSPEKAPPVPSFKIGTTPKPTNKISSKNPKSLAPPFAQREKLTTVATKIKEVTQNWESTCDNLLTEIDSTTALPKDGPILNCRAQSMFWSRESIRYLDECIKMAESNNDLLEKLQRVQTKSKNGSLSYNDYRAVIKLHGAMLGK